MFPVYSKLDGKRQGWRNSNPITLTNLRGFIAAQGNRVVTIKVKLDHCVIHVPDWERSNYFYRDVLGAELVKREVGLVCRFGDAQLNLHGPD